MTKKDFLKELKDYFTEHEWKEHDEKKVMSMLERYRESIKTIYLVKKVEIQKVPEYFDLQPSAKSMEDMAKEICDKHQITIAELKVNSPISCYKNGEKRRLEYIHARADFCRTLKTVSPNVKLTTLKNWFGYKCHSSIIHLIKHVK